MKKFILLTVAVIAFIILMTLPGFVLYIVGDIANRLIPDKKEGDVRCS